MFWVITAITALTAGLVGWQIGGHPTALAFALSGLCVVLGVRSIKRNNHAIFAGTLLAAVLGYHFLGWQAAIVASLLAFSLQLALNDFIVGRHPTMPIVLGMTFLGWWLGWSNFGPIPGLTAALAAFLGSVAIDDFFLQRTHTIRTNFPLIGWFRYGFELVGDELRQYWFLNDLEETPYNRKTRRYIYRSAKGINNNLGFGTQERYSDVGQIHMLNAMFPIPDTRRQGNRFKPIIIGKNRAKPYICPWPVNISGMSYGALSEEAVMALSSGAKYANIHLLTGEGGLTPYHLNGVVIKAKLRERLNWFGKMVLHKISFGHSSLPDKPKGFTVGGGRILVQLGPAKFGFRRFVLDPVTGSEGRQFRKLWSNDLDEEKLAQVAQSDQIAGFEIKLAQGAKPGQGGKLPKEKITPTIADWRGVNLDEDCYSPNAWDEFNDVPSLFAFVKRLQELTGKPIGIKIVVGNTEEIRQIAALMKETGEGPDMITIDGGEGGTGAAPGSLADMAGLPIRHAIPLVDNILREHGVRDNVVLIASGQIATGKDVAIAIALGADMVNIARANMISGGCIMALRCHTNTCPTGWATQDPRLRRGLNPADKYVKVANYNLVLQRELLMLCRSAGVEHYTQLTRHHLAVVTAPLQEKSAAEIFPYPDDGKRNPVLGEQPEDDLEYNDRFGPKLINLETGKRK